MTINTLTKIDKTLVAISLGIDKLSQTNQDDILSRLERMIMSRLTSKVSNLLSDEELKKFEVEGNIEMVAKHVKNFDELAKKVAEETIDEFRGKINLHP